MRAVLLLTLVACTPEVASGTYFCGADGHCPEGQACNGPDNTCVLANQVLPFECTDDFRDVPGDDTPATGHLLENVECVSRAFTADSCLVDGDGGDWFQLDVPASCGAVQIVARVTYPVAFESLGLQVSEDGGAADFAETPCASPQNEDRPERTRCLTKAVQPGHHYAVGVVPDGTGTCNGTCLHNRYSVVLQLTTP